MNESAACCVCGKPVPPTAQHVAAWDGVGEPLGVLQWWCDEHTPPSLGCQDTPVIVPEKEE